jgi:predicted small lipoprotein YifL
MSSMMHESKIVVNCPRAEFMPPTWGTTKLGFFRRMAWLAFGVSLTTGTLTGCGQKGPLYLPAANVAAPLSAPSNAPSAPTP